MFSAISSQIGSIMCCKNRVIKRKSRLDFNESKRFFLDLVTGVEHLRENISAKIQRFQPRDMA